MAPVKTTQGTFRYRVHHSCSNHLFLSCRIKKTRRRCARAHFCRPEKYLLGTRVSANVLSVVHSVTLSTIICVVYLLIRLYFIIIFLYFLHKVPKGQARSTTKTGDHTFASALGNSKDITPCSHTIIRGKNIKSMQPWHTCRIRT